ncbi:hypothetical protein Aca07nite_85010 [Actinoplanes capillaceus]|uniref:HEAT repeat domain-containing protein n=1 Tax=Actinoplanes campanulatus TaxID=113559 RepID=A0ABQ3WY58_9ACTN|nr:hypothetical protein [Actinoplanes capillaceus]GID51226.1 hypothetical protein Aca07nite_85010 [Actinoplanes capillaceus]
MAGRQEDWIHRWNADRLILRVEQVLQRWEHDPRGAADMLSVGLRTASARVLVLLEAAYRDRQHTLAALIDVRTLGRDAAAVAALLTFDRSGHLRETGTRWLAGSGEAFALPFLLLRVNDPVEVVRQVADAAVREWLATNDVTQLVPLLPLIETLGRRRHAGPLISTVTGLFLAGDREPLRAGVRSDDPAVHAASKRLLATATTGGFPPESRRPRTPLTARNEHL